MKAILFGSIGTIAETSEMQRASFNDAFQQHKLPWTWEQQEYSQMLQRSGGINRVNEFAKAHNVSVDASAVHSSKFDNFARRLEDAQLTPRPGVLEIISWAKQRDIGIGMVTTTYRNVIEVVLNACKGISIHDFDIVCDLTLVENRKPAADCYDWSLRELNLEVGDCIAIEDNIDGIVAAQSSGIDCLCFAGENTASHPFPESVRRITSIDPNQFVKTSI